MRIMKNLNTKSIMIITIVFSSVFTMPIAVMGQENEFNDVLDVNQIDVGIFQGFMGGFGGIFSNHLGYGGHILGSIFETIFLQGLNLSKHEMLGNTFVLSANRTHTERGTYNFESEFDQRDVYLAPMDYLLEVPDITGMALNESGYAYCLVEKNGEFDYEVEVGAAVTLIIWDNDGSFITAINNLLNFFKQIREYQFSGERIPQDLIKNGISLIAWFLIHINDIFTGDELFVLNPITWQKLTIKPGLGFNITKTWYFTGPTAVPGDDDKINSVFNGTVLLDTWNSTAQKRKDSYMEWLLTPTHGQVAETIWTQFSFDLIQLWIKNFEIHIDVNKILDVATGGSMVNPELTIASAFEGCNIDFFLFTHHLAGAFLYNDTDASETISAVYTPIDLGNNRTAQVPHGTELTHRLILGTVGSFRFDKPDIDPSNRSISWGIDILDANVSAVPLGVDLHSYLGAPQENLDYIHFGFTFEPKADAQLGAAHGLVKLNQFFAPWNEPEAPDANSDIPGLDLAIIYVSTVLHFELDVRTQGQIPEAPQVILQQENYKSTEHKLKVGNYIGRSAQQELEFVDIAGPMYEYGSESARSSTNASTSIIPLIVWEMEHERHDTFTIQGGQEVSTFASDIRVQTELSVMVYAVCYPQFEDGTGIWHDPTFSVYMVFESEGFWALIVLIAGVGLVGVATILIKRRKDQRF